jgi:hypothetical protein
MLVRRVPRPLVFRPQNFGEELQSLKRSAIALLDAVGVKF